MMAITRRALVPLVVAAASLLWAPAVSAQCGTSLPFGHFLGSYIEGCLDNNPVDAVVSAFGATGTTGTSNVVCEAADEVGNQGGGCQTAAGVRGDGRITISGNYANPGAIGACPNPTGVFGTGRNLYALRDNSGGGIIVTVGYDQNLGLYDVEGAHKGILNDTTLRYDPVPLRCLPKGVDPGGLATGSQILTLDSLAPGPPPVADVTLRHPFVFSDCDPDSVGTLNNTGSCDPVADVGGIVESSGNLFVTTGSCAGTAPARAVCNGGSKAGQPCSVAVSDCGSLTACVQRWQPAGILDPFSLPAQASITLPTSACVGGNNPEAPCTLSSQCGGRCSAGARAGLSCITTTSLTGTCQGGCTAGTAAIGTQCTSNTGCGTNGICTIWPCTLGTCSPLATTAAFANQCVHIGSTLAFNGLESSAMMTTSIAIGGGGPGAPSARALDVRAVASAGNVNIHFSTAAELQLVGFNVLTETKAKGSFKVNDSMIAPKGAGGGGATYDVAIGRGKFQGGKTVIIESVLSDGTKLRSDAAQF